ncbi:hypothetical protein BJY01DRAFT_186259 [Aspergillus pseudoustus]|uniref:Zn(2)-C6 fungal-type domain-containing protein n=1 Tax=Aspergillus pseudoustus TaxID=1810923 RepID=A0ABR4JWZ8_9EURO
MADPQHHPDMSSSLKKPTLACEKCRVLKVKCIRVEGEPCTKCKRSNSECIVPEPKQRTRPHRSKLRLVDLESKLTDILGLLGRPNASSSGDDGSTIPGFEFPDIDVHVGSDLEGWMSHDSPLDLDMVRALGPIEPIDMPPEAKNEISDTSETSEIEVEWAAELGLTPVVLQHLSDSFRGMSSYFPFMRLPENTPAAVLVSERPFLFLAAVTNGSSRYRQVQAALREKFKAVLSENLIIAGEKDLDLLQGLLVHLTWFHFYFNPRSPQTYRYLQIAISMAVDLVLDKILTEVLDGDAGLDDTYKREACRTYLGCYYISSVISTSSGKPNSLPFSADMLRAASALQRRREFDTDDLIYPLLQLQQFVDEICETYRLERQSSSCSRSCTHTERFALRLEEWWSSVPADLRRNALLINGYHATKIRIYEMGLVYNYGHARRPVTAACPDSTLLSASPGLINNLIKCTESTKSYLDLFLTIPETEYARLPFCIWYKVILALFVLYRLAVGVSEVPEWDVNLTLGTVDVERYLGLLADRLECLRMDSEVQNHNHKSLFTMLPEVIGSVRMSYAMAKGGGAMSALGPHPPHQPFAEAPALSARGRHRCPGMRNLSRAATAGSTEQPDLQSALTAEIQMIENELFWSDLLVADTFSSTGATSSTN